MTEDNSAGRRGIIEAVTTPLAFIVLGLLVIDASVGALAFKFEGHDRMVLVWTLVGSVAAYVLLVTGLAIWKPEALSGTRPWQESYGQRMADDLLLALEGPLENLQPGEREEAWLTLADIISSVEDAPKLYQTFCVRVATRIRKACEVKSKLRSDSEKP